MSINDVSITEGNNGTVIETFTVTRTGGDAAFNVNYTTADGTATVADGDYDKNASTLVLALAWRLMSSIMSSLCIMPTAFFLAFFGPKGGRYVLAVIFRYV